MLLLLRPLRTILPRQSVQLRYATMASSNTPIEDAIRTKLTTALSPRTLEIYNDSHKHAHHSAMRGVADKKETHFRYTTPIKKGINKANHLVVQSRSIFRLLPRETTNRPPSHHQRALKRRAGTRGRGPCAAAAYADARRGGSVA
jgi:stress-induced morphogen